MISTGVLRFIINAGTIKLSKNIIRMANADIIILSDSYCKPSFAEISKILHTENATTDRHTEQKITIAV